MTLIKNNNLTIFSIALVACLCLFITPDVMAGGLEAATNKVNEITTWARGFVLVCTILYALYCVVMALIGRSGWGEVAMAFVYGALAGGIVEGIRFAQTVFN